jgi:hypothetical protein
MASTSGAKMARIGEHIEDVISLLIFLLMLALIIAPAIVIKQYTGF